MKVQISLPAWPWILGLVFIVLRLCNVIAWSWWWVLAPFWIPACIAMIFILVVAIAKLSVGGKSWRK